MSVIPVFRRWKQEDYEFETSLGYFVSLRLIWCLHSKTLSQNKTKLNNKKNPTNNKSTVIAYLLVHC
jgi:hypothetical protein